MVDTKISAETRATDLLIAALAGIQGGGNKQFPGGLFGPQLMPTNLAIVPSVASNALTIAIKGADGNDPSVTNPVVIPFRDATVTTGTPGSLTLVAALSLVVPNTATMGFVNGEAGRLWLGIFNDAGTPRIGAVNCLSGTSIRPLRNGLLSATSISTAADSAHVIYADATVTTKPFTIIGYVDLTEATAGVWATAHSAVKLFQPGDSLPGECVQVQRTPNGAGDTTTTAIPYDDTIPQNTEGKEFITQAVTAISAANLLLGDATFFGSANPVQYITAAIFVDSVADAIAAGEVYGTAAAGEICIPVRFARKAGTTSAQTFKLRAGGASGSTVTFNGASGARKFGGVFASFMEVREIMA